jgi:hypothetical protein
MGSANTLFMGLLSGVRQPSTPRPDGDRPFLLALEREPVEVPDDQERREHGSHKADFIAS